MKKLLIAAGVASLAVAVVPVVGVFAATSDTFTDTITVNVDQSCTINSSGEGTSAAYNRQFTKSISVGQLVSGIGGAQDTQSQSTVSVSCNTTTGSWSLSAVGAGAGTNKEKMHYTSSSGTGTDIATGTATTGATSNWAMMIEPVTGANIATGFNTYHAVPTTATPVVTGNAGSTAVSITPAYQVYIGTAQEPGTYEGKVTYTLTYTGQ